MVPTLRLWNALGATALVAAVGIYVSSQTGDWSSFARSGAVIVVIGAVVAAWDCLRAGNGLASLLRHLLSRERAPSETLGVSLIVVGTLIWAFGDLVGGIAP